MPVSTSAPETSTASRAKRCKHCEESGHRVDSGNLFWRIQLDQDLLDTIVAIYPEWFKDYNLGRAPGMADGASGSNQDTAANPPSSSHPPSLEESPLQRAIMDKNKESLKVKLMLRRPINQLVAQGIMPPLKTSPAFHEQRQKLERAKMGDLLKAKIQQRPDRQELVRQHILEDMTHIDPSLAERQRMLKKARLVDALNDQLSHRPGPLELIKKNILHTEEPIERAVKEGVIPFKATCEGQLTKPQHPNHYVTYDEDSQSSEGAGSPVQPVATLPDVVTVALAIPTSVVVTSAPAFHTTMTFADLCNSVARSISPPRPLAPAPSPVSLGSTTSSLSPLSSVSSPPAPITPRPMPQPSPSPHRDAPGKDKNRKKSKSKSQPKTRTIKFHEYKGPPNAHKSPAMNASPVETSYEILLQQQQLFLQWQLEWQHKYPQIILPAAQKPVVTDAGAFVASTSVATSVPSPGIAMVQPATPMSPTEQQIVVAKLNKLEDMKVSDLKAELKRRNLPVSGSKPQLIERLRPFTDSGSHEPLSHSIPLSHMGHIIMDIPGSVMSEESLSGVSPGSPSTPPAQLHHAVEASLDVDDESVATMSPQQASPEPDVTMETSEGSPPPASPLLGEDIVREQQRRIKELQRELHRSQLQLQQIRHNKEGTSSGTQLRLKPTSAALPSLDAKQQQKLMLQQHLQNKIQQQQLQMQLQQLQQLQTLQQQQQQQQQQRQQQHVAFQKQLQQQGVNAKASLAAFLQSQSQLIQANNNNNNKNGTKSIVLGQEQAAIVLNQLNAQKKLPAINGVISGHQRTASLPNFFGSFVEPPPVVTPTPPPEAPPHYEEAAKQLKIKLEVPKPKQKNVKSQIVDDVLEILIKNGELPASAAQDPATPTTPGRSMPQGLIFTAAVPPASPPAPPPPPPPPLPHTTFAITLPTAITLTTQAEPFQLQFTGADSLDFILGRGPSLNDPAIDLKELGLDLETLDSMDFGQLDCGDLVSVKMEPVAMEVTEPSRDQLINQQPCELMDIEMPMEMDDSDWLESLMPSDGPTHDMAPTSSVGNFTYQHVDIDTYDPLLSNSQDPFDLFNIEDSEFKMAGDLNSALGWDKVDFAT